MSRYVTGETLRFYLWDVKRGTEERSVEVEILEGSVVYQGLGGGIKKWVRCGQVAYLMN